MRLRKELAVDDGSQTIAYHSPWRGDFWASAVGGHHPSAAGGGAWWWSGSAWTKAPMASLCPVALGREASRSRRSRRRCARPAGPRRR